ncbi:MAG: hypothetical protein EOM69_05050 [Clostridia bacterium]|nr:hypothetical protein [Clostridia bacterium]
MQNEYVTVNLEEGMPLVEQAIKKLTFHIHLQKGAGVRAMKLIHGFGSSGKGGRIRVECRAYLASLKRRGVISAYIPGEDFSIFDAQTRQAIDRCGALRRDRDLERHNNGITIVLF